MSTQQPSLSTRARWIIRTQLAAASPGRKQAPGIHTQATGFPLHQPRPRCGRRRLPGRPAGRPAPLRSPPARPDRLGRDDGGTRPATARD